MKKSRRIDVKGLIRAILLKWPLLIAALLVFGAAGCGKYYRANHNVPAQQTSDNEKAEETQSDNKDYNQSQKEAIDREITWLNQFIDESPANKIDSYKAGYASATLYISGGNGQIYDAVDDDALSSGSNKDSIENTAVDSDPVTNMVAESLRTFLTSGIDWSEEKKKFDVAEDAYLYDLMNVRISGNTITVSMWYDTPENAESILNDVISQTDDEFKEIKNKESLDDYTVTETTSGSTTKVLTSSDNWVTQRINQLRNLASSIENSNAVKTAQGSVSGNSSTAAAPEFSKKDMLKSGVKYGAAGLVLMAFLLMIWILKKGYVLSEAEFAENTGMKKAGEITSAHKELDVENLQETLKNKNSEYQKIAIVSDLSGKSVEKVGQIGNLQIMNDLLANKEEREKLKEYDGAVICFKANESQYADIEEMQKTLGSRGIRVLGYVSIH